jgi:hypothetical protein
MLIPKILILMTSGEICGGRNGTAEESPLSFFGFLLLIAIPTLLNTHLLPPSKTCDSSDHAAHYHIHVLYIGVCFSSVPALGWLHNKEPIFLFSALINLQIFVSPGHAVA